MVQRMEVWDQTAYEPCQDSMSAQTKQEQLCKWIPRIHMNMLCTSVRHGIPQETEPRLIKEEANSILSVGKIWWNSKLKVCAANFGHEWRQIFTDFPGEIAAQQWFSLLEWTRTGWAIFMNLVFFSDWFRMKRCPQSPLGYSDWWS